MTNHIHICNDNLFSFRAMPIWWWVQQLKNSFKSWNFQFYELKFNKILIAVLLLISNILAGNNAITSCEGSRKYGPNIYIDFHAISSPCTCTALLSFDGVLSITLASGNIFYDCGTEIYVNYSQTIFLFACPVLLPASNFLNVQINQSVDIRANYTISSPGTFYQCLRFQQNGKYVYIQKLTFVQKQYSYICIYGFSFFIEGMYYIFLFRLSFN